MNWYIWWDDRSSHFVIYRFQVRKMGLDLHSTINDLKKDFFDLVEMLEAKFLSS